jgi:hypothetical protein
VGVWAAYDRPAAWHKFWLLIASALLFYALAGQPRRNIRMVMGFVSICGAILAIISILSPSTVATEIIAGTLGMTIPIAIAWGVNLWHRGRVLLLPAALIPCGLMVWAVIMSGERDAWFGISLLALLLPVAVAWSVLPSVHRRKAKWVWGLALLAVVYGLTLAFLAISSGVVEWFLNGFNSHWELITNTAYLAKEFPFIGGGLRAYAGLYSRYLLVIPHLFSLHSHNIILDVAVEQGWIGLASLLWILIGSGWLVVRGWSESERNLDQAVLRTAVLCSLFFLVLHNLTEDVLYSAQGAIGLFLIPGLCFLASRNSLEPGSIPDTKPAGKQAPRWMIPAVSGAIILLGIGFWRPITAAFYANLGVVEMAHVHLAGWPADRVEGERLLAVIGPAELTFQKALQTDPNQLTALYHLGMISVERREYEKANGYLAQAYEASPGHYGIRKLYGYSYLWLGNTDQAAGLLRPDSETLKELDTYIYWWTTQNRDDLSALAQQLSTRMHEGSR